MLTIVFPRCSAIKTFKQVHQNANSASCKVLPTPSNDGVQHFMHYFCHLRYTSWRVVVHITRPKTYNVEPVAKRIIFITSIYPIAVWKWFTSCNEVNDIFHFQKISQNCGKVDKFKDSLLPKFDTFSPSSLSFNIAPQNNCNIKKVTLTSQRLDSGIPPLRCCHVAALWRETGKKEKHEVQLNPFPAHKCISCTDRSRNLSHTSSAFKTTLALMYLYVLNTV